MDHYAKRAGLKELLSEGGFLVGTHVRTGDSSLTELLGMCGFDYLWIDTEHTAIDYNTLQQHLIAARAAGCPAVVRVPRNEQHLVKRVLDMGAEGIVFPMIRSYAEAKDAVASCFYPDEGSRSFGPVRAAGYGLTPTRDYLRSVRESLCVFLQLEHIDMMKDLDGILDLAGLSGIILGPCDLSFSMGLRGRTDAPEVASAVDRAISHCREKGVPVGISLGACDAAVIRAWKDRGMQFVSANSEYCFILRGASELIRQVKG